MTQSPYPGFQRKAMNNFSRYWGRGAAPLTRSLLTKDLLTAECHPCQVQHHTVQHGFWIHTEVGKPEMLDHRYMGELGHLPGKVTWERMEGPQVYGWGHF